MSGSFPAVRRYRCLSVAAWCIIGLLGAGDVRGANYYIHPTSGSDSNNGAIGTPWKTLKKALTSSPVAAGDTVFLRGGNYYEDFIWCTKDGAAGSPITIRNYAGETPVIYGTDPAYTAVPNTEWTLVDAGKNIYKSVKLWDVQPWEAMYQTGSPSKWYALVHYTNYAYLSSTTQYYSNTVGYYAGPGYYWESNPASADYKRVFIRLTYPATDTHGQTISLTHSLNPNNVPLYLPRTACGINFDYASYIDVIGLKFVGYGSTDAWGGAALYLWNACHHFNFKDITADANTMAVMIRQGTHVVIDNLVQDGHVPPYIAWSDTKDGPCVAQLISDGDGVSISGAGNNIEIKNSKFRNSFDAIRIYSSATGPYSDIHVHHNDFAGTRDDTISMGVGTWNVDIHDNRFVDVSKAISRVGGSNAHVGHPIGTVYIHHNIIDIATMFQTRRQSATVGPNYTNHQAFGTHGMGSDPVPGPWKLYHNTVINTAPIMNDGGLGHEYAGLVQMPASQDEAHEAYNNIIILKGSSWHFGRSAHVGTGQEIYDGNIYWRTGGATLPFANPWYDTPANPNPTSFASLAAFKSNSTWYNKTKAYYAPGWENSGLEADPGIDSEDYYPTTSGWAATAGVNLSGKGWPGAGSVSYRGALPPRTKQAIATWSMNNTTLPSVPDSTAFANHGSAFGNAAYTSSGYSGYGLLLDGDRDGVQVTKPVSSPLNKILGDSFTIELWAKGGAAGNVLLRHAGTSTLSRMQIGQPIGSAGVLDAYVGGVRLYKSGFFPNDAAWHKYTIVFAYRNSIAANIRFYRDGTLLADKNQIISGMPDFSAGGNTIYLGSYSPTHANLGWLGTIDEVNIYNYPKNP